MSRLLKGNYELPESEGQAPEERGKNNDAAKSKHSEEEFERRALERLGGSIAFVMKSKTFLWNGDGQDEPSGS